MAAIEEALRGLTRRQLEELRARIDRELVTCMACGNEGAEPIRASRRRDGARTTVSLPICPACFERHRMPESRAEEASLAPGAGGSEA